MFKVTLTNGGEDLFLYFKLRETDIAKKWYKELSKSYELFETDRFSNWNDSDIIEELNYHINVVNQYDSIIDQKVTDQSTQQDLNYLHKFFEDLRGEIVERTEWFNCAPEDVKKSIQRFNILVHQFESSLRTKNKHPTLVVTFKGADRLELSKDDMKHFTYKWTSGTIYINYCHVGKTVLDVFKDRDYIAKAVRPQTHYSADFMIKFGPTIPLLTYIGRSILIKLWLLTKNFRFKHLNLGMIPVADLQLQIPYNILKNFNKVKSVECIK